MKNIFTKTILALFVCITAAVSCFAFAGCGPKKETAVTSLTLNKQSLTITQFTSEKLIANVSPSNAKVTWGSLDESKVIVDASGNVRGLQVTTYPVIVTAIAGNKIAICAVNVIPSADAYEQTPSIAISADSQTASPIDPETKKPIGYTDPITLYEDVLWIMAGTGTDSSNKLNEDIVVDGSSKTIDGISYTQRIKLQGKGTATARSIKLTLDRGAKIVLHCVSSSNKADGERVVNLYDEDYNAVSGQTFNLAATSDPTVEALIVTAPGTYYIGTQTGGLNIYGIYVYYEE